MGAVRLHPFHHTACTRRLAAFLADRSQGAIEAVTRDELTAAGFPGWAVDACLADAAILATHWMSDADARPGLAPGATEPPLGRTGVGGPPPARTPAGEAA